MKNNRLQFLLKLLVDNKINAPELEELAVLMAQPGIDDLSEDQLKDIWDQESKTTELNDDLYRTITQHPRFTAASSYSFGLETNKVRTSKLWFYVAATVLLCCGIVLTIYLYQSQGLDSSILAARKGSTLQESTISQDHQHVTLKLSNGKQLILDKTAIGKIGQEDHISITKNAEDQLVYDLSKVADHGEMAFNTIETPIGSHYQVVLSDGTKVWLNAKSSLTFPAVFKGSQRQVELSGEAYFEVAHNKKQAFIVTAKDMKIQVLGTHFNVSAYADDEKVEASLLEGVISVSHQKESLLLQPGQQASLNNIKRSLIKQSFDVDEVMDWKNGYFIFRNEPIDEIMKKISRWYHIEVAYQGKMTRESFGGKYLKSNSLQELLSSLELTGTVEFKVQGRRVTVVQ